MGERERKKKTVRPSGTHTHTGWLSGIGCRLIGAGTYGAAVVSNSIHPFYTHSSSSSLLARLSHYIYRLLSDRCD